VQTHEQHDNTMIPRTIGALALRPTGNAQGNFYFLSLSSGRVINRTYATPLPMPDDVIDRVHQMARQQKANPGMLFADRRNVAVNEELNAEGNDFDSKSDDDDSDYNDDDNENDDDSDDNEEDNDDDDYSNGVDDENNDSGGDNDNEANDAGSEYADDGVNDDQIAGVDDNKIAGVEIVGVDDDQIAGVDNDGGAANIPAEELPVHDLPLGDNDDHANEPVERVDEANDMDQ
jgi:hypothetical protein